MCVKAGFCRIQSQFGCFIRVHAPNHQIKSCFAVQYIFTYLIQASVHTNLKSFMALYIVVPACSYASIESSYSAGVEMIAVGLLAEKADIKYNPLLTTPEELVNSIKSLGFGASLIDTIDINDGKIELLVK